MDCGFIPGKIKIFLLFFMAYGQAITYLLNRTESFLRI